MLCRFGKSDASMEEVEAAARAANAYGFITALPEQFHTMVSLLSKRLMLGSGITTHDALLTMVITNTGNITGN